MDITDFSLGVVLLVFVFLTWITPFTCQVEFQAFPSRDSTIWNKIHISYVVLQEVLLCANELDSCPRRCTTES